MSNTLLIVGTGLLISGGILTLVSVMIPILGYVMFGAVLFIIGLILTFSGITALFGNAILEVEDIKT